MLTFGAYRPKDRGSPQVTRLAVTEEERIGVLGERMVTRAAAVVAVALSSAVLAPAGPVVAEASADGRVTVVTRPSVANLAAGGGSVTYGYTVTNNHSEPLYFGRLSDTACPAAAVTSGLSYDSAMHKWALAPGASSTFTCTTLIRRTTTNTVTAEFSTASGATSTATDTSTVAVGAGSMSCDVWWSSSNTTGAAPGRFGTYGSNGVPVPATPDKYTWPSPYDGSSAMAVNPTDPNWVYYVPRTGAGNQAAPVYRFAPMSGASTQVVPGSTATNTLRLAFAPDGTLWSLPIGNTTLYSLAPGATTWVAHTLATPATLLSGDMAFDGLGNMYLLLSDGNVATNSNQLVMIPAGELTKTSGLTSAPLLSGFYDKVTMGGLAFAADGTLYSVGGPGGANQLYRIDLARQTVTPVGPTSPRTTIGGISDLGSCATPMPALRVTKTVTPDVVTAGQTLTYTVTIENIGSLTATGVTFTDATPANTTYGSSAVNGVAVTGATNPWLSPRSVNAPGNAAGTIPPGGAATVTMTVTVDSPLPAGTTRISNHGSVALNGGSTIGTDDPASPGANDPTDAPVPAVRVVKSASTSTVTGSGPVTYTYIVSNPGGVALTSMSVTDDKCSAPTLTAANLTTGEGDLNGNSALDVTERWVYTCDQTLTYTGSPSITNLATVSGVAPHGGTVTATDTATVSLQPGVAAIDVAKAAGTITGPVDGVYTATYTVTATNTGTASGTVGPITDTPAVAAGIGVDRIDWTGSSAGSSTTGSAVLAGRGTTLAPGDTLTYTVTITFRHTSSVTPTGCAGVGTGLYNAVSSGGIDIDPTNDHACLAPPVPPAPIAVADTRVTPHNTPVTLDPWDNDTSQVVGVTIVASTLRLLDTDGNPVTSLTTSDGTYTVNTSTGAVTFAPTTGYTGTTESVRYVVEDSDGVPAESTITITVYGPPTALDDATTTPQNTPVDLPAPGNDSPGNSGAAIAPGSVRLLDGASPVSSLTTADGGWTVNTTTGLVTFTPTPTFTGIATADYVIADTDGVTASATLRVTVTAIDPTANPDTATTPYGTAVTLHPSSNDTPGADSAPIAPATVRLLDPDGNPVTSLTTNDGTYTVNTATGDVTFTPAAGFTGTTEPVRYRIEDTNGTKTTSTVTVTVHQPPNAVADVRTGPQNTPLTVTVLDNDTPSPDSGKPLRPNTVRLLDPLTADLVSTVAVPGQGRYDVQPDGIVLFTPVHDFRGTTTPITYQVEDADGIPTRAPITVTITPVTPIAQPDAAVGPYQKPVVIDPLANDTPGNTAPLDPTTVRLIDPSTGAPVTTVQVPDQGTWTVNTRTGVVTFTPVADFVGTTSPVRYTVADRNQTTTGSTVRVTIAPVPIALNDHATTTPGQPVTIRPLANDNASDSASLDPRTVALLSPDRAPVTTLTQPGIGTWEVSPDGTITLTPQPGFTGIATVDYQVTDNLGQTVQATVTVTVQADQPTTSPTTKPAPGSSTSAPGTTTSTTKTAANASPTTRPGKSSPNQLARTGTELLLLTSAGGLLLTAGVWLRARTARRGRHE